MTVYSNLSKLIFLGNFPELDTDEGAPGFEGSTAPIIGTILSGPAANSNVVSFDYDDLDNDGRFEANHVSAGEMLTVGAVSSAIDKAFLVAVNVELASGSTYTTSIVGFQLENGDFYLSDLVDRIEGQTIKSLEVTGISDTSDAGDIADFQSGGSYDLDNITFVVCFEASTRILTEGGEKPIGTLTLGDLVMTADNGLQPIRWISRTQRKWDAAPHKDKPVSFSAGSLGNGLPRRDLLVSPQHKILMSDPETSDGVLVPAKKMFNLQGVRQMKGRRKSDYVHIMFDAHEVIWAEGVPAESFFPGPLALKTLPLAARNALSSRFPGIDAPDGYPSARSTRKTLAHRVPPTCMIATSPSQRVSGA